MKLRCGVAILVKNVKGGDLVAATGVIDPIAPVRPIAENGLKNKYIYFSEWKTECGHTIDRHKSKLV